MRRWVVTGVVVAAATTTWLEALSGCDLDLKPYVDPVETGGPLVPSDSGGAAEAASPDAAPDDASSVDGGDAGDGGLRKRIFVSSTLFTGNLGGVAGANAQCQQLAKAANLGGTFVAWLSVTVPPDPVVDRLQDVGPWYLVDRKTLVLPSELALAAGALAPIDHDEKGIKLTGTQNLVWTGTQSNGQAAAQNCGNFAAAVGQGLAGNANKQGLEWTQSAVGNPASCAVPLRLYCLEQ